VQGDTASAVETAADQQKDGVHLYFPPMSIPFLTKKDAVVERLRDQIISGVLAPGTRLQQHEVARALDVSPTPVREAFLALQAERLLSIRPHYGAEIVTPKFEDLRDTFRVRGLVEIEALRLATKHLDAKTLAQLERHTDEAELALRTLDSATYRRASAKFHEVLVGASQSDVFTDLGRQLIGRTTFPLERGLMAERLKDHRDLVAALRNRRWERAEVILRRHMDRTPAVVREIIRRSDDDRKPKKTAIASTRPKETATAKKRTTPKKRARG
jgi:DNA-binding GntR family transcriptional regulator